MAAAAGVAPVRTRGRLPGRVQIACDAIEDMVANFDVIASGPLTPEQRRSLGEARQSVLGFAVGIQYPFLLESRDDG